jgi:hypothetical protein
MTRGVVTVSVSSDLAARRVPFIYAGYASSCGALYLGETRGSNGVLGRIAQHISETSSNTFRQRVCAVLGCDEVALDGVEFVGVALSGYAGFASDSPEYRRAVEYNVQLRLLNMLASSRLPVTLVSRVAGNGYTGKPVVVRESEHVAMLLHDGLARLMPR